MNNKECVNIMWPSDRRPSHKKPTLKTLLIVIGVILLVTGGFLMLRRTKTYLTWKTGLLMQQSAPEFFQLVAPSEVMIDADENFSLNVAHMKCRSFGLEEDYYCPYFLIKMNGEWKTVEFGQFGLYPYSHPERYSYQGYSYVTKICDYTVICISSRHNSGLFSESVSDSLGTQPLYLLGNTVCGDAAHPSYAFFYRKEAGGFLKQHGILENVQDLDLCIYAVKDMPESYTLQIGDFVLSAEDINEQIDAYPWYTIDWPE